MSLKDAVVSKTTDARKMDVVMDRFAVNQRFMERIPYQIREMIDGIQFRKENIGCSGSKILIFENDLVLKTESVCESSRNEHRIMGWLKKYMLVPEVHIAMEQNDISYLLMSKMKGKMSCDLEYLKQPKELVHKLAQGMKELWKIPIIDCPTDMTLSVKLRLVKDSVENGTVDVEDFEEDTFGVNGFSSLWELYNYLEENAPSEDLVVSHGDYCLPNIFCIGAEKVGLLDLGNVGIADRYQDIALCLRSLRHNLTCVGFENDYEACRTQLFQELGITPDDKKIRYYTLMDELF